MLLLFRKTREEIVIGRDQGIRLIVVDIGRNKVRLGIEAPRDIPVHRREVQEAIDQALNQTTGQGHDQRKAG